MTRENTRAKDEAESTEKTYGEDFETDGEGDRSTAETPKSEPQPGEHDMLPFLRVRNNYTPI